MPRWSWAWGRPTQEVALRLTEDEVRIEGRSAAVRAVVVRPVGDGPWPGVLFYSDIFQLTESTLRTARRLASAGFAVVAPEIYPRSDLAGVALEFDDEGKRRGSQAALAMTTAEYDADRDAVLAHLAAREDVTGPLRAVGFCLGGHLAYRAALDARVAATVCFYPTGVHDGRLGADADAGTLGATGQIAGRLMLVFGTLDPHVPAAGRAAVVAALVEHDVDHEVHVFLGGEHAFMRDVGPRHDPALTDEALAAAVRFLRHA